MLQEIKEKLALLSEKELKDVSGKEEYTKPFSSYLITETKAKVKTEKLKKENIKNAIWIATAGGWIEDNPRLLDNLKKRLKTFNDNVKEISYYEKQPSHFFAGNSVIYKYLTKNDFYYRADKGYKCFKVILDEQVTYLMSRNKEEAKNQFDDFDSVTEVSYEEFYNNYKFHNDETNV